MSDQIIDEELQDASPASQQLMANPFPGLRPFKIDESHLFFGREGQSDEVLLKLSKNRFVGVIGPSGSGKSSFIYCGVLPILYGGFLTNASPNWEVIVTRPGASPIENLGTAILEKDASYQSAGEEDRQIKETITNTLLKSSSLGLVEAIMQSKRDQDKNYLVLVDQFEELFRFKDSDNKEAVNETLAFVNMLIEATHYADAPIYVAITMRSDFIGDCAQFPDLTKKINDSHYLIPQMTREQKRKAITGPVAVGGAEITPRLIQQLLNDLGDNPDQLPILQHSLMRTWSYWTNFGDIGEPVDTKHYEAIGTMKEALSMHANEAFDELDEEQKQICEVLFKAITEKRGENFGIRRPTRLSEIASILDVAEEDVIEVIDKFRAPGRSLITPAHGIKLSANSIVDISHESLMRIWVRLKNWVDEEAEAVSMYLRLADAASMYQVGKAGLWRPPDLQLALNWQVKHKPTLIWGQRYHPAFERTMVFLEYSKKEFDTEQKIKEMQRKKQLRTARITALTMGAATVISLLFLLYAFQQKTAADDAKDKAIGLQLEAQQSAEAARVAEAQAKEDKKLADEANAQAQIEKQKAIDANKLALEEKAKAEQAADYAAEQARLAKIAEGKAVQQKEIADKASDQANKSAAEARIERDKAEKLRFQALSSSMALKSVQLKREQRDLKGLLAQHAYLFNIKYDGKVYDNDVYNGLYFALKEYDDPLVADLGGHNKAVKAIAANATSGSIYTGDENGKILKWRLDGVKRVADTLVNVRGNAFNIYSLGVVETKYLLLAGGQYPNIQGQSFIELLDLSKKGEQVPKRLNGFNQTVTHILVTNDEQGAYILDGKSIKYTDFDKVTEVATSSSTISDMALSKDGKWLITATKKGLVTKYDIANNMTASTVIENKQELTSVGISDKNEIAIGQANGTVKVFGIKSPDKVTQLVGHESWVNQIRFSSDGQFIATASNDKTVRLWNRDKLTEQPTRLANLEDWAVSAGFNPDNTQLLVGTKTGQIKAFPTHRDDMATLLCGNYLKRNMTDEEWDTYVTDDAAVPTEITCGE